MRHYLSSMKTVLQKAKRGKYGVGQFNFFNIETAKAIISAGEKLKSPIILGATEGALRYGGLDNLVSVAVNNAKATKIPIVLHLDHGQDEKIVRKCIRKGFTSVMIDGSYLNFEKNIKLTKKIVEYAHKRHVDVEAELGQLKGCEDNICSDKHVYTDPDKAKEFVEKTGCDSLAIAIGTSHGAYKFSGSARLKYNILEDIRKKVKIPLVLHGASSVYPKLVTRANRYGAKLGNARGVSDASIRTAISKGVQKVNTDTDLRLAFTGAVREILKKQPKEFDPRKIAHPGIDAMQKIVEHKIKILGSQNKGRK